MLFRSPVVIVVDTVILLIVGYLTWRGIVDSNLFGLVIGTLFALSVFEDAWMKNAEGERGTAKLFVCLGLIVFAADVISYIVLSGR